MDNNGANSSKQESNSSEQEFHFHQLKYLSNALKSIAQEMQLRSEILLGNTPPPFENEASTMTG